MLLSLKRTNKGLDRKCLWELALLNLWILRYLSVFRWFRFHHLWTLRNRWDGIKDLFCREWTSWLWQVVFIYKSADDAPRSKKAHLATVRMEYCEEGKWFIVISIRILPLVTGWMGLNYELSIVFRGGRGKFAALLLKYPAAAHLRYCVYKP